MPDAEIDTTLLNQVLSSSVCNNKSNYTIYPDYLMTPIKTLRISFDVIQKTDGSGSYLGTDVQIVDFFNKLINASNQYLSNIQTHIPSVTSNYIPDSRIRFELNKVHFFKSDDIFNITYGTSDRNNAINIYNNHILPRNDLTDIDKNHTLHIIMEPAQIGRSFGGQAANFGDRTWVVMRGYDEYYNNELINTGDCINTANYFAHHVVHEVGHSLGLYHTFDCYDCSDYSCTPQTTNNLMDYPNYSIHNLSYLTSLTECQISKIHYSLMGYFGTISQDFINDYCYFDDTQSFSINSDRDIIWNNARNLNGNLTVNGKLNIKCNISLPQTASVIVQNGGILTIDQGVFDNLCNNDWEGITVKSGGLLTLNSTNITDYNIIVENGGSIQIKGSLVMSGNHNINIQSGGYLCVESGTSIQLTDYNSVIKMSNGALNGVNPSLSVTSNCISNPIAATITGSGSIVDYSQDVYIQNLTISASRYIGGKNIFIGNHVTTSDTFGDVLINNGANIIFDCKEITFDAGFECAGGSTYEVKNH